MTSVQGKTAERRAQQTICWRKVNTVLANANPALLGCWHPKQTDRRDPTKTDLDLDFPNTQTASLIAYGKKSGKERSI